ncbi:MAG: CelA [Frankiales bacterium]|nr:CelA [Frankiales bacterium]
MTSPSSEVVVRARLVDELSKPIAHVRSEFAATAASTTKAGGAAAQAARDYDRLAAAALKAGNDAGRLDTALARQHQHAGLLAGSLGRLASGYVAFQAAQAGFNAVATQQDAQRAFEGLLGSQKEAVALARELQDMKSPFGVNGLFGDAQSLLTFGATAGSVVPTLRALSDAVAGTGGNSNKLTATAQAFAELRQSTFLTSGALGQLQSQGLPAADILAKAHGMSQFTLQRALDSGALRISGQQAADELLAGFEQRYKGQADKASSSLRGSLTNLGNSASKTLADAIAPELPQITAFVNQMATDLPGLAHAASPFLHVLGDTLGIMAAHPHLTEALAGFLLLRTAVGPALDLARATREIAAGMALINAAQGPGGVARSVMLSTVGMNGGIRGAGAAASAETAAARGMYGAELGGLTLGAGAAATASRSGAAAKWGGRVGKYGTRGLSAAVLGLTVNQLAGAGDDYLTGHFGHANDGRGFHWQDAAKIFLGEQKWGATGAAIGGEFGGLPGAAAGAAIGGVYGAGKGLWDFAHHRQSFSMSSAGKTEHAAQQQASSLLGGVQINIHGQSLEEIMQKLTPQLRQQIEAALQLQASGTGRPRAAGP